MFLPCVKNNVKTLSHRLCLTSHVVSSDFRPDQLAATMATLEQQSQEMVQASSAYVNAGGTGATSAATNNTAAASGALSDAPPAPALSQSSSSLPSSAALPLSSSSSNPATVPAAVSTALPFLCFPNGDALLAFEQDEVVQSVQRLMDRRQTTVR